LAKRQEDGVAARVSLTADGFGEVGLIGQPVSQSR
jgi:hypothetical protein